MTGTELQHYAEKPIIRIVDDDVPFRRALQRLLQVSGYEVIDYGSVGEILLSGIGPQFGCIILDIHMPGPSGLDLQEMLAANNHPLPLIFVTGETTIGESIRAMKAGAADFLCKPLDTKILLDALEKTLIKAAQQRMEQTRLLTWKTRYLTLTPREKEVLKMVSEGSLNKQISAKLKVAERTVKAHRAKVMEKMEVATLAELVRIIERLHL